MDKNELLEQVKTLSSRGDLSREELLDAYNVESKEGIGENFFSSLTMFDVLFYVGGLLVFIGISMLSRRFWEPMPSFGRIGLTLGVAVFSFAGAVSLEIWTRAKSVAISFYWIAGFLLPTGMFVFLKEIATHPGRTDLTYSGVFALLILMSGAVYLTLSNVTLLFSSLYGSAFIYSFTYWLLARPMHEPYA